MEAGCRKRGTRSSVTVKFLRTLSSPKKEEYEKDDGGQRKSDKDKHSSYCASVVKETVDRVRTRRIRSET